MYVRQCGVSPLTLCVVESVGQLEWPLDTQNKWPMAKSAGPKHLEGQGAGGCWCLALFGILAHGCLRECSFFLQNVVCRCRV